MSEFNPSPLPATEEASERLSGQTATGSDTNAAQPSADRQEAHGQGDENRQPTGSWASWAQSLTITVVIAVFVITFIVQAFQIPSESMEKTLLIGDYLLVDKTHYGPAGDWKGWLPYDPVRRGDIIVFRYPVHPNEHFVKRVIGLPGDHIHLSRKHVFVNGKALQEAYAIYSHRYTDSFRDNFPNGDSLPSDVSPKWYLQMRKLTENGQLVVPPNAYFVLGDNRDDSLDSRYWGFVPRENIIGRPLLIYWSLASEPEADEAEPQDGKLASLHIMVDRLLHGIRWRRMMRIVE